MIDIEECRDHELLAGLNKEIQDLHHDMYPEIFKPYDRDAVCSHFQETFKNGNTLAFTAIEGNEVLGYVLLIAYELKENAFQSGRKVLLLDQILVRQQYRNNGVGKALLQKVVEQANERGVDLIELNHWTKNEEARKFFTGNGFTYFNERMSIQLK